MRILGVDPGSRITGYGVISLDKNKQTLVEFGVLRLETQKSHELRLKQIYDRLQGNRAMPAGSMCNRDANLWSQSKSMLKLGRAQASCMLAALNKDIPVIEYTPKEVKKR